MSASGPIYRDLIERGARANGHRIAAIVKGRAHSFAEIDARANRLARALVVTVAARGARVAVLLDNGPDSIPVDFAMAKAGLNRVPLNARLALDEHVRMVRAAGCGFLLFGPSHAGRATDIGAALPELALLALGDVPAAFDVSALAERQDPVAPDLTLAADDIVLTLYTSGTTGVLKAAQHTQGSYAAICRNVLLNLCAFGPDDRMLHAASLIHASGTFVLPLWLRGGCSVVLPGFAPDAYAAAIAAHGVTAINLVPTMLRMLLDHPGLDGHDLSSLRQIIYGASPMPRPLLERAIERFGRERFWQYYGQTEAPLCIAVLRPEDHVPERLGACGRPALDVAVRLLDDAGEDAGDGPGEIAVRAPSAAAGYHDAGELTAATFRADGWVLTRDVGRIDGDGFLHLLDRTSDMIVTGGYNVYPREVEDALASHPDVAQVAVVGMPDETWVEAVTACVVLREGRAADADALTTHVAARIASYKKPRRIVFVADLPVTAIGKLDRRAVRARLGARGDGGVADG